MVITESLIICYSTPNYDKLANLVLSSLYDLNVERNNIKHKLDIPQINLSNKTGFMTKLFHYSIINKVKHLINTLNENKNEYKYYISTDLDIRYLQKNKNKWNELKNYIDNNINDIFFMREGMSNDVNGGFFIIKNQNIEKTIHFLTFIFNELITKTQKQLPMLEQQLINENKHKINFSYIPNKYVIFGTEIYDINSALFHHAIGCADVDDKIKQINNIKSILLKVFYLQLNNIER